MIPPRRIIVRQTDHRPQPVRLAVGDIIRCPAFALGLRYESDEIIVAWKDATYPEYRARHGTGTLAHDDTRGSAPFLVSAIELVEGSGPEDVYPGNHRLTREVHCLRLTNDFCLPAEPERIRFALDEPMSVIRVDERELELLGCADFPISWDER